ncbi:MAG: 2-nitropropane dioxygenase, partial [Sphingomonadales bacterium]
MVGFLQALGAEVPIVQAPMAGAGGVTLAVAAMRGGAVGSLPCAMLDAETVRAQADEVRAASSGPLNLNFFCHALPPPPDEAAWRALLAPFYAEEGVVPGPPPPLRRPFDNAMCSVVE